MRKGLAVSRRDIFLNGEKLHEMIAADISAEYERTRMLERDKAELSRLMRELEKYYLSIDDTVRRQEILQARINIHDEMNGLMLSTASASVEDKAAIDSIFSLWEKNALLLCMEADKAADAKAASGIEQLAAALNIRLIWQDVLPDALSDEQRGLFFSAAKEAIANAAKHAKATTMTLSFSETDTDILCDFANDGIAAPETIAFAGGLRNLSLLADKQGAAVSVNSDKEFTLSLRFSKNVEKSSDWLM